MAKMRATRVEQREVVVAECPICGKDIAGVVEVAIYMGAMKLDVGRGSEPGKRRQLVATVTADPKVSMRSLQVQHRCDPADVENQQEGREPVQVQPDDEAEQVG